MKFKKNKFMIWYLYFFILKLLIPKAELEIVISDDISDLLLSWLCIKCSIGDINLKEVIKISFKILQQPFKFIACTQRLEVQYQNVTKFYQIMDAEHDCHQRQDLTQGRSFYAQTGSPVYQSVEASFPAFLSINSHI